MSNKLTLYDYQLICINQLGEISAVPLTNYIQFLLAIEVEDRDRVVTLWAKMNLSCQQ